MPERKPRSRSKSKKKLSEAGQQPGVKRGRRRQEYRAPEAGYQESGVTADVEHRHHSNLTEVERQMADVAPAAHVAPQQHQRTADMEDRHHGNRTEVEPEMADVAPAVHVEPAAHVAPHQRQGAEDERQPPAPDLPDQEDASYDEQDHGPSAVLVVPPYQQPPRRDGEELSGRRRLVRKRSSAGPVLRFLKGEWREMRAGWARLVVVGLIFLCFGYWIRGMQSTQEDAGGAQAKLEAKPSAPSGSEETIEDQSFPSGETADSTNGGKPGALEENVAVNVESAPPAEGPEVVEMRNSIVTNPPRGNPLLLSNALMQEYFIHQRKWLQLPEPERAARQKAFNELEARIMAASSDSERNALMNELHELP